MQFETVFKIINSSIPSSAGIKLGEAELGITTCSPPLSRICCETLAHLITFPEKTWSCEEVHDLDMENKTATFHQLHCTHLSIDDTTEGWVNVCQPWASEMLLWEKILSPFVAWNLYNYTHCSDIIYLGDVFYGNVSGFIMNEVT